MYRTSSLARYFSALLFTITFTTVYGQVLPIPSTHVGIDTSLRLIVVHQDLAGTSAVEALEIRGEQWDIQNPDQPLNYQTSYSATRGGDTCALYFTRNPLIQFTITGRLNPVTKIPMDFTYVDSEQTFHSSGGVEYRGGTSLSYPKKNYDIEFESDPSFGGLREDDDWILDAMYNEPGRGNAYVAHKIWLAQHQLYYADEEPKAKANADLFYVEVFENDCYMGIFCLSEQLDRKQLKLKKFDADKGGQRGELFKAWNQEPATNWEPGAESFDNERELWSGYEYKYPQEEDFAGWDSLVNFYQFVTSATDEEFTAGISSRLDLDNAIDNFLFINLLNGTDNLSKNFYVARYNIGEPYLLFPWDLDGTLGNKWDGTDLAAPEELLTTNLYARLLDLNPNEFNSRLRARYANLRAGVYALDSLKARFTDVFNTLTSEKLAEREMLAWPLVTDISAGRLQYTHDWIDARISYLDALLGEPATSVRGLAAENSFSLYPNPTNGRFTIRQSEAAPTGYQIFSILGRKVLDGQISGSMEVDISALPSGRYAVRVGKAVQVIILR